MKSFVAFFAVVAVAVADVSHIVRSNSPDAQAEIVQLESDVRPDGFESSYQTSNGISGQERGQLKTISPSEAAVVVEGSNSWTSPEGQKIVISYVADENGYRPVSDVLPTPPAPQPIPEYILRSLRYIEENAPRVTSGQRNY